MNKDLYWIDRRLTGLAGPEYDATISFGLPFESEDCPYGESRSNPEVSPSDSTIWWVSASVLGTEHLSCGNRRPLKVNPLAMFLAPVAVHLLLVKDGKVLLLRRYNTGYEDGNYSVVAGHIDGGEELKAAMIREAREEAGIEICRSNLEVVGVMHFKGDREYVHFFLKASVWSGEITNMEPDKCDDLSWFGFHDLPDNTIPYIRRAIENYCNDIWCSSVGWE